MKRKWDSGRKARRFRSERQMELNVPGPFPPVKCITSACRGRPSAGHRCTLETTTSASIPHRKRGGVACRVDSYPHLSGNLFDRGQLAFARSARLLSPFKVWNFLPRRPAFFYLSQSRPVKLACKSPACSHLPSVAKPLHR